MSECPFCGDELISFVEELEDGSRFYLVICPTCYKYRESEPLKQSNQIQSAKGEPHGGSHEQSEWGEPVRYLQQIGEHELISD